MILALNLKSCPKALFANTELIIEKVLSLSSIIKSEDWFCGSFLKPIGSSPPNDSMNVTYLAMLNIWCLMVMGNKSLVPILFQAMNIARQLSRKRVF